MSPAVKGLSKSYTNDHFLTYTTKDEKWLVLVGLAVPGRLSLPGTEARPTELFSYKVVINEVVIRGTGVSPVQAQAKPP